MPKEFPYRIKDDFKDYLVSECVDDDLLKKIVDWINRNLKPEDIFPKIELEEWAETHGYEKEE